MALSRSMLLVVSLVLAWVPGAQAGGYAFVDIDYPATGAANTINDFRGINNAGQIVGSYNLGSRKYAFIKNGDTYSTLPIPGYNISARAINDAGKVSGSSDAQGYVYDTTNGSLTPVNIPGASSTAAWGINNVNWLSGSYNGDIGFRYDLITSSWISISKGGATITSAYGINNLGTIVGHYTLNGYDHGFTYNGTLQTFDFPGAQNTRAVGINDHGDIAGRYWNSDSSINGFVYINGVFHTITIPGGQILRVSAINNARQIVGLYTKDNGATIHGFLATPVSLISTTMLLLEN